ncbi:MAG: anti-sigma F factor [Clostridiales bacterium]|uniref:anti-sigma F factor n=1 Tax=Oscillospiraceae TaxID=216572 RepID=UPI0009A86F58|nr:MULTISPECIES: anti-sigma F factor [Oscillospiraceae]PWM34736.1 MAG: anti-sigma F factor [Clostridiales bacterium]RGB63974.1 anti-sigma F factor [Harryflintia acetispora]
MKNSMKLQFDSRSCNESFARTAIAAFAAQLDPTYDELSDIKTAVSEAVTNCIVHAYAERLNTVYITASINDENLLTVKVRDRGCGIPDIKRAMEPLFTTDTAGERAGLGFAVMQSLCDKVRVRSTPGKGTTVTLIKKLESKR